MMVETGLLTVQVRMLNYKKCGTAFWNNLHIAPVRNAGGQVSLDFFAQADRFPGH